MRKVNSLLRNSKTGLKVLTAFVRERSYGKEERKNHLEGGAEEESYKEESYMEESPGESSGEESVRASVGVSVGGAARRAIAAS